MSKGFGENGPKQAPLVRLQHKGQRGMIFQSTTAPLLQPRGLPISWCFLNSPSWLHFLLLLHRGTPSNRPLLQIKDKAIQTKHSHSLSSHCLQPQQHCQSCGGKLVKKENHGYAILKLIDPSPFSHFLRLSKRTWRSLPDPPKSN